MKQTLFLFVLLLTSFAYAAEGDLLDVRDSQDDVINVIFDTDIGGDIDDAFALAVIHRLADQGVCNLLGVTLTNENPNVAPFVAAENALYGRPNIPVGAPEHAARNTDRYLSATLAQKNADGSPEFPVPEGFTPEEPIALLRRLLANAPDRSVVMIQVGFSTNLAALLDSHGDDVSPLTGKELVAQKVRLLSIMGGSFAPDPSAKYYVELAEWNIKNDVPAARKLVDEQPTEIVFSGAEVGDAVRMSPTNLKRDYRGPKAKFLRDAFAHWASVAAPNEGLNHRRPTWDITSVLFVLRPEEGREYYRLSEPLDVTFDDKGVTQFAPNPESKRRIFLLDDDAKIRVSEAIVNICSEP